MGQVTAHPNAIAELREAIRYYDSKSAGLGRRFFAEVEFFIGRIVAYPTLFVPRVSEVRRANLKRFPFNINFLVDGENIAIVAIAHNKRQPFYWLSRLPRADRQSEWPPLST
jgi:toxin ParE1/3/4